MGLTQVKAAKAMNINQSAVSQYLNCKIALNTDAVLRFAKMLNVHPAVIDPDIIDFLLTEEDPMAWIDPRDKLPRHKTRVLVTPKNGGRDDIYFSVFDRKEMAFRAVHSNTVISVDDVHGWLPAPKR